MNSQDLEILVKVKDEASSGFQKMSKDIKSSSKELSDSFRLTDTSMGALKNTIAGVAVAGGAMVTAFLYSSVKAAGEAQVAMAKMDATLKTMGKSALQNRDAILEAADAATQLGFDDEDAALSITKFYQRTNDLTKATQLNNLAMDLARAKHLDLASAANLVNMAVSGQGKVLMQYGINIREAATPLEALKELQKQVAGQANAFSKTFEGQMTILSIQFANIKEEIGGVLLEALMPFIQQFTAWLTDPKTKENFAKWTASFQEWASILIPIVIDVFKLWAGWLKVAFDTLVDIEVKILSIIDKAKNLGGTLKTAFANAGSNIKWAIGLEGRASGGPVSSNTPYMVGENGPELFVPRQGGTIIPNGQGIGTQLSVVLNGNFYGTDESTAEKFADMIASTLGKQLKLRTI
jgi:hypothetical protein